MRSGTSRFRQRPEDPVEAVFGETLAHRQKVSIEGSTAALTKSNVGQLM